MAEKKEEQKETIEESHLEQIGGFFHNLPESVHEAFARHRQSAFQKHPFFFSTIGLLGLVATWQGFDDVMERVRYFDAYPGSLLIAGLIILLLTGRLYRQMDR
jgi:hypothetical protein